MNTEDSIQRLTRKLIEFRDARDWGQFHNPKDLSSALSIEAAELQELFLWKPADSPTLADPKTRERLAEELADIAAYLFMLCHGLQIDLEQALEAKIEQNGQK